MCLTRPADVRRVLVETENTGLPHQEVELERLGYTHEHIGTGLLRLWGLPEDVVQTVRFHHRPSRAPAQFQIGADLVHVADVVASAVQIGNGGERSANPLDPEAWDRLGLSASALEPIVSRLSSQVSAAVALMFDPA
jgi:HD-like signal output (HDOD) protein